MAYTSLTLFTNTFLLDGKIKLLVAGVSESGRKKWVPLARKSVSFIRKKVIFKNRISPMVSRSKKNLQIKEYCFK